VRYLTDEWFEAVREAGARLPRRDGFDLVIDVEVAGSPDGKVRYHEVWQAGRLAEVAAGKHPDAQCSFALKYPDAMALVSGELDAHVGYMQGRLKVDGAYERWLYDFRPLLASAEYRELTAAVADATDFD